MDFDGSVLQIAFIVEAVVASVGHDKVVNEPDIHGLRGLLYDLGQAEVVIAGACVTRGMVVYQGDLCGSLE